MPETDTPSSAMFSAYKEFAQISNKSLASVLLSDSMNYGDGKTPRSRIGERTFLSREVVHAEPGKFPPSFYANLFEAAQQTYRMLVAKHPGDKGKQAMGAFYCLQAADAMCAALRAFGKNDLLYRNMLERLATMSLASEADRLVLMTLQFEVTGCFGDPGRAADMVQEALRKTTAASFRTSISDGSPMVNSAPSSSAKLGLCRVVDGNLRPHIYPLRADATGTEIGSLATASGAINDVEPTVSRRHLRIYQDADGEWYAVGLESTNGTILISGADGSESVVEAPRKVRQALAASKSTASTATPANAKATPESAKVAPASAKSTPANAKAARGGSQPVRIQPGDQLVLGGTTRFMVLGLAE